MTRRVNRSTDRELAAALTSDRTEFLTERRYLNGWVIGSKSGLAKVSLLWCDGAGRRGVDRFDFEHYFLIRSEDLAGRCRSVLRKMLDGVRDGRRTSKVRRWEVEPDHPQWTRVYVDVPPRYFFVRYGISAGEYEYVNEAYIDGRERSIDMRSPSLLVTAKLHAAGIQTYEGDLIPMRRFVADNPIHYPDATEFTETYLDIEVDDRHDDMFQNLGRYRILSIGWESKGGAEGFLLLEEETDEAERRMLRGFVKQMGKSDIVFAWNGSFFDYYYLFERCRRLGVRWKWWETTLVDLLPVFKRYHFRAGAKGSSYALDKLHGHVVGGDVRKIDLAGEIDRRFPGARREDRSAVGVWSAWYRDPELLREYNLRDCRLLRELEESTGYAHLDFVFSEIGNCFANDFNVSTKVDGLMVRKGHVEGVHFVTADRREREKPEKYEGGYVHEPVRGLHDAVCAFDFKSLYPSMMQTFNISPETFVSEEDRGKHRPDELIETPIGTTFLRPVYDSDADKWEGVGFVPQMFAETLHKRAQYADAQAACEHGSDEFLHYYRLSYSYKRLGLSFYGELGNWRGRYYNQEVARSVTLSGQHYMKETIRIAGERGFRVLYGDTDSVYIQMPDDAADDFVAFCQVEFFKWLPSFNAPEPLCTVDLEWEDVYSRICLVNKKRYFGRLIRHKGVDADVLEVKGLEVMRSDGLALARDLQDRVMRAIMLEDADSDAIWQIVTDARGVTERGPTDADGLRPFAVVKGLSKTFDAYKTTPPHVRAAQEFARAGGEVFVGSKIPFVWVEGTYLDPPDLDGLTFAERLAAWRLWETLEVAKSKRCQLPPKPRPVHLDLFDPAIHSINSAFYWDRHVYPPTYRVVEVAFPELRWLSLNSEEQSKQDRAVAGYERRLAKHRKRLLSKRTRTKAFDEIKADNKLTDKDRSDLRQFYMRNVLAPG